MNDYLSRKLKVMSAVAILMVLYIHSFYTEGVGMPFLSLLENTVGDGLCRVSVPLFYVISGYLFFLKMPTGLSSIPEKLRKRVKTLLIPYILTNILVFILFVLLNIVTMLSPRLDAVVNTNIFDIVKTGVWFTIKFIFIDPPVAFQLWFLRDLMIVMLLSPVIYILFKWLISLRYGLIGGFAILLAMFVLKGSYQMCAAFVWFSVGSLISISGLDIKMPCTAKAPVLLLLLIYLGWGIAGACIGWKDGIMRYISIVGMPALWFGYDILYGKWARSKAVTNLCSYTFFIYLAHEPLLNILKKLPLLVSHQQAVLIISYIFSPIIFYIVGCVVGRIFKNGIPKAYNLLVGNR